MLQKFIKKGRKMKISKKLIKNVLVKETENLSDDFTFNIKDNYILFVDEGESQFEVNIYEFAFKCKEWALNKGYTIESHTNRSCLSGNNYEYFSIAKIFKGTNSMRINTIEENTEIESTIQACKWILKEEK